jgi:hypothetical protein
MCKHNPGRTGAEQPSDFSLSFMLLKFIEKITTCKKESSPLTEVIAKAFKDHSYQVKLKPMYGKALIDFPELSPCNTTEGRLQGQDPQRISRE